MPSAIDSLTSVLVNNLSNSSQPKEETYTATYTSIAGWGDNVKTEVDIIIDETIPTLSALCSKLADDESYAGAKTFEAETTFQADVSSTAEFTSSGQPRCLIYSSAGTQSIANNSFTSTENLTFDSETADVGGMFSPAGTTVTIPAASGGLYMITAQVTFDVNATGVRRAAIFVNSTEVARNNTTDADATEATALQVTYIGQLSGSTPIQCRVFQNSGGALNVTHSATSTWFAVTKLW